MAWTTPRTWTDGEVVTATMMNLHVRDNENVIKVTRDAVGHLTELSSDTVDDLSAANLTGLAVPATGNSYTGGRKRFSSGSTVRFVLPVGADKYTGNKGTSTAKGVWVEGDYLHHIAQNGSTEYRFLGAFISTPAGAVPGSAWVEGVDLHYIDEDGDERKAFMVGAAQHSDAPAIGGSAWVETYVHWVRETGTLEYPGHADAAHGDHSDHNDHTDHNDSGTHGDATPHTDTGTHTDHTDGHQDHNDIVHVDVFPHGDSGPHGDHNDHSDTGPHSDSTPHGDQVLHTDSPAYNLPVVVP